MRARGKAAEHGLPTFTSTKTGLGHRRLHFVIVVGVIIAFTVCSLQIYSIVRNDDVVSNVLETRAHDSIQSATVDNKFDDQPKSTLQWHNDQTVSQLSDLPVVEELPTAIPHIAADTTTVADWSRRRRRSVRVNLCPVGNRTGLLSPESHDMLFERLASDSRFEPVILSRNPWVLQFDRFFAPEECAAVLKDCDWWEQDMTAGVDGANVRNTYRNSSSFSCGRTDDCATRPGIQRLRQHIADVLGIGQNHSEDLNVLRYEPGGFYKRHHDYILPERNPDHSNCGPRVLTFMTFLTDVEDGGGTNFFHLDIVVKPRAGRAVLWADTLRDDPMSKDERTAHEALTVVRGTKIVTTTWLNQYDRAANEDALCCHRWTSSAKLKPK